MIEYPSISKEISYGQKVWAFDKLDGSQVRAEWHRKHGEFTKFGLRTRLLPPEHEVFGDAIPILRDKYEEDLNRICKAHDEWDRCVFYFEYFGTDSFAGKHDPDDDFDVVLFDMIPHSTKDPLPPQTFVEVFGREVETVDPLYAGPVTEDFVEAVKDHRLQDMTYEGVVCKSEDGCDMFKVKSDQWLEDLRSECDNQSEFRQRA